MKNILIDDNIVYIYGINELENHEDRKTVLFDFLCNFLNFRSMHQLHKHYCLVFVHMKTNFNVALFEFVQLIITNR